ncbi:putative esterase [Enhygromyxa salina]|uniref:Putative esterase n=1 Tax=Enhygromyxa salina TaxID=215803 RepID=A0A2S9YCY1_9BACT|nr:alpha/beta hydrolase-fold protein [Enhygromyxa salina]PRQ02980.1 putative esterase [Enhygromyxa salina]
MFKKSTWYSERMQREATLARWGFNGQPVLVFPTAGGDAEEIERFLLIRALEPLIAAGRIKVYSCDSTAGHAMMVQEGTPGHRMWLLNQFHQYVRHEVVPAIRMDCNSEDIGVWTTGASIGAFHAVAVLCRWPNVFHRALGMSGTWNILRFFGTEEFSEDYFVASPLQFVPTLAGVHLDELRKRFVLLASGAGRAEDMGESWAMARALGAQGVPNRVDPWGEDWHHDWPTWRNMLPKYLDEWTS